MFIFKIQKLPIVFVAMEVGFYLHRYIIQCLLVGIRFYLKIYLYSILIQLITSFDCQTANIMSQWPSIDICIKTKVKIIITFQISDLVIAITEDSN